MNMTGDSRRAARDGKPRQIFANVSYAVTSNFISMLVSTLTVLVIPKFMGVQEYGYWQLYLFYSSYVLFAQLGWSDGVYLRYGGRSYEELDRDLFFSQFVMLAVSQAILTGGGLMAASWMVRDPRMSFILQMTAAASFLLNLRSFITLILQGTNRFRAYARVTLLDKWLGVALMIGILLFSGKADYKPLMVSDLLAKAASLAFGVYCCRELILRKLHSFAFSFGEMWSNIGAGIKLLAANTANMLMIGTVRIGIERTWDIAAFGRVSLMLNLSNFILLFLNAVGMVMFPLLRKIEPRRLPAIYESVRGCLMPVMLGVLAAYYPLRPVLAAWLPEYEESLRYLTLLLPICVFEGKMSLLINPYFKALRKESRMLKINITALILSIGFTLCAALLRQLDLAVASIIMVLAIRCMMAERVLAALLNIRVFREFAAEAAMTLVFMTAGWFLDYRVSFLFYIAAYIIYLTVERERIGRSVREIKLLLKA